MFTEQINEKLENDIKKMIVRNEITNLLLKCFLNENAGKSHRADDLYADASKIAAKELGWDKADVLRYYQVLQRRM